MKRSAINLFRARGETYSNHYVIFGELLWKSEINKNSKVTRSFRNIAILALRNDLKCDLNSFDILEDTLECSYLTQSERASCASDGAFLHVTFLEMRVFISRLLS